jgi:predicted NBD/HSP70 family sugar kinase
VNEIRGSGQLGKAINRTLVLNLIKAGPISRAEIAEESGLSAATVTNITNELIGEGLVGETGAVETSRGRPRVMLRLASGARFVVGVKVMPDVLVAVVTDLDANVVARRSLERWAGSVSSYEPIDISPDIAGERLAELVEGVIGDAGVERASLLGVGVALAGIVDGTAGICRYSPFFGWHDVDLAGPLQARIDLEVHLANDVDSLTIAEQWFGHGRGIDDFVVVTVGRGVGAGFVFNGRFYGGRHGGVGELAHVVVAPDGPRCACGKRGCLEALAGDKALVDAARQAIASGRQTSLSDADGITVKTIASAADDGDELARELLMRSGRWLGYGMALLVNLLNPQLLIVAGEGVEAGEWRLAPMRRALREARFDSLGEDMRVVVESAGDTTWARGAACVVLSEFFKSPLHRRPPTPRRARERAGVSL